MKDDLISRQDVIDTIRRVCLAALDQLGSHYDEEACCEVYDNIKEVDLILGLNKALRIAVNKMEV